MSARGTAAPAVSGRRDRTPRTGPASGVRPGPPDTAEPSRGRAWRDLLRAERLRLGLSQVELGALVGVSPETIRKYEAGGRPPARTTLVRLVAALQLSAVQVPVSEGHQLVAALPPPASAPSVSD